MEILAPGRSTRRDDRRRGNPRRVRGRAHRATRLVRARHRPRHGHDPLRVLVVADGGSLTGELTRIEPRPGTGRRPSLQLRTPPRCPDRGRCSAAAVARCGGSGRLARAARAAAGARRDPTLSPDRACRAPAGARRLQRVAAERLTRAPPPRRPRPRRRRSTRSRAGRANCIGLDARGLVDGAPSTVKSSRRGLPTLP